MTMKRFLLILFLMGVFLPVPAQQYRLDPEASAAIRARLACMPLTQRSRKESMLSASSRALCRKL